MSKAHRGLVALLFLAASLLLTVAIARASRQPLGPIVAPPPPPVLPATPYSYADQLPLHLEIIPDNIPPGNPITDHGATLGRVLFYDRRLSLNNRVSCASCHPQATGFSDPAQFSAGFVNTVTRRNSMGLANLRFFQPDQFFWDTRALSLENLAIQPIVDDLEMGNPSMQPVLAELAATSFYPELFENAFGTPTITTQRVAMALGQFMRALVSYNSPYDIGVRQDFANFTPQEQLGLAVFLDEGNCGLCHNTDTQLLLSPRNNGLDVHYADNGLGEVTGNPFDNGLFKPPTLRNVALTAPYMHDGRFETLAAVVEHYSSAIQPHANLDPFLPIGGFNFSQTEKDALVAFMNTLTDPVFLTDERFADPFPASAGREDMPPVTE